MEFCYCCYNSSDSVDLIEKYCLSFSFKLAYLPTMPRSDFAKCFMIHAMKARDKVIVIKENSWFKK